MVRDLLQRQVSRHPFNARLRALRQPDQWCYTTVEAIRRPWSVADRWPDPWRLQGVLAHYAGRNVWRRWIDHSSWPRSALLSPVDVVVPPDVAPCTRRLSQTAKSCHLWRSSRRGGWVRSPRRQVKHKPKRYLRHTGHRRWVNAPAPCSQKILQNLFNSSVWKKLCCSCP